MDYYLYWEQMLNTDFWALGKKLKSYLSKKLLHKAEIYSVNHLCLKVRTRSAWLTYRGLEIAIFTLQTASKLRKTIANFTHPYVQLEKETSRKLLKNQNRIKSAGTFSHYEHILRTSLRIFGLYSEYISLKSL